VSRRRSARHLVLLVALIALCAAGAFATALADVLAGVVLLAGSAVLIALDAASRHAGRR